MFPDSWAVKRQRLEEPDGSSHFLNRFQFIRQTSGRKGESKADGEVKEEGGGTPRQWRRDSKNSVVMQKLLIKLMRFMYRCRETRVLLLLARNKHGVNPENLE